MKKAILLASIVALPLFAFAQGADTTASPDTASSPKATKEARIKETMATRTQEKMTKLTERGSKEIDQRISDLTALLDKTSKLRNLSSTQKDLITTTVQTVITNLTTLKGKIGTEDSTTTLRDDIKAITQANRVYALIIPEVHIIASADRVTTLVSMLGQMSTKLQLRIGTDPKLTDNKTIKDAMSDLTAKITDAQKLAQDALNIIGPLGPDNGDKTKFQSNVEALKSARTKIQSANKDIVAARKDVSSILKLLPKEVKKEIKSEASSTTQ